MSNGEENLPGNFTVEKLLQKFSSDAELHPAFKQVVVILDLNREQIIALGKKYYPFARFICFDAKLCSIIDISIGALAEVHAEIALLFITHPHIRNNFSVAAQDLIFGVIAAKELIPEESTAKKNNTTKQSDSADRVAEVRSKDDKTIEESALDDNAEVLFQIAEKFKNQFLPYTKDAMSPGYVEATFNTACYFYYHAARNGHNKAFQELTRMRIANMTEASEYYCSLKIIRLHADSHSYYYNAYRATQCLQTALSDPDMTMAEPLPILLLKDELLRKHYINCIHADLAPGETLLRLALRFRDTCRLICHTWSLCQQLKGRQWAKLYAHYGNEFFTTINTNAPENNIDWIRETQAAYQLLSALAENKEAIELDPLLLNMLLLISDIEKEKLLAIGKKSPQAAAIIVRDKRILKTLRAEDVFSLGLMHAAADEIILLYKHLWTPVLNCANKSERLFQLAKRSLPTCMIALLNQALFSQMCREHIEELSYLLVEKFRAKQGADQENEFDYDISETVTIKIQHNISALINAFVNYQNCVAAQFCYYLRALAGDAAAFKRFIENVTENDSASLLMVANIYADSKSCLYNPQEALLSLHRAARSCSHEAGLCLINRLVERNVAQSHHAFSFNFEQDLDSNAFINGLFNCSRSKKEPLMLLSLSISLAGLDILRCLDPSKSTVNSLINNTLNANAPLLSSLPTDFKILLELITALSELPIHYLSIRLKYFRALYAGFVGCNDLRFSVRQQRLNRFITEQLPHLYEQSVDTLHGLSELAKQAAQIKLIIKKLKAHSGLLADKSQKCLLANQHEECELYLKQSEVLDNLKSELKQARAQYYERDFSIPNNTWRNDSDLKQQLIDILARYFSDKKSPLHMHFNLVTSEASPRNLPCQTRNLPCQTSSHIPAEQNPGLISTFELNGWIPNNTVTVILVEILQLLDQAIKLKTKVVNSRREEKRNDVEALRPLTSH